MVKDLFLWPFSNWIKASFEGSSGQRPFSNSIKTSFEGPCWYSVVCRIIIPLVADGVTMDPVCYSNFVGNTIIIIMLYTSCCICAPRILNASSCIVPLCLFQRNVAQGNVVTIIKTKYSFLFSNSYSFNWSKCDIATLTPNPTKPDWSWNK